MLFRSRLFFEETAGITRYRDRKRESVRKLEAAEQNLTRVADIQQEIRTQLEPLAKEAKRTATYGRTEKPREPSLQPGIGRWPGA